MIKEELIKQVNNKEEKINNLIKELQLNFKNDDNIDIIYLIKKLRAMI